MMVFHKHSFIFLFGITILSSFLVASSGWAAEWISFSPKGGINSSIIQNPIIEKVEQTEDNFSFRVIIHGMLDEQESHNKLIYDKISLPGIVSSGKIGNPYLPDLGKIIAIPYNAEVSVNIRNEEWINLSGYNILPYQPQPNRCGQKMDIPFEKNDLIYRTDYFMPKETAYIEAYGILRDVRAARVVINPVKYNPFRSKLRILKSCEISISFNTNSVTPQYLKKGRFIPDVFAGLYKATFLNASILELSDKSKSGAELMLALVSDDLMTTSQPFFNWKLAKGIKVVAVPMSQVGNTVSQIKAYIQNAYDSWSTPPSYIEFIGNEDTVVPDHRGTSNGNAASDYPYTLLSGDDIYPDVLLGRLVANNTNDVAIQVAKIVSYEKSPFSGSAANWYHLATGIASSEGSNPSDKDYMLMIEQGLTTGNGTYTAMDHFFQGEGTATKNNINTALNSGRSWLAYIGHGSGSSWGSTNDTYNNSSIAELGNGFKMPIIIDVACENGSFDETWECFGEAWMRSGTSDNPKGAVGYYGGSVSLSWDPPAVMSKGCAIRHFSTPVHTWGGTCLAGQLYLIEQMGAGSDIIDNLEWFILFGDPSLLMRTDVPKTYLVQNVDPIFLGQSDYNVTVLSSSKAGIPGAIVCMKSDNEANVSAVGTTDGNGLVTLHFSPAPSVPGSMKMTITGYNLDTLQKTVSVQANNGPYIVVDSKEIDDSILGNGNQHADYNETVNLTLSLKNVGTQNALNVQTVLSSRDTHIQITDSTEAYGNISPSQIKSVTRGFRFSIAGNTSDAYEIPIHAVFSEAKSSWQSDFSIIVHSPKIEFESKIIDDTNGNSNGIFDAGETILMQVNVKNTGSSPISNLQANLSTSDQYCTIISSQSHFISLPANGTAGAIFRLTSSINTPIGHIVDLQLDMSHLSGFSDSFSFITKVGLIGAYIWNPSGNSSTVSLLTNYYTAHSKTYEEGTSLPADLSKYQKIYVLLGIYSNNYSLTSSNGDALAAYLDEGNGLYMEGGDTWSYDPKTAVHSYFHIQGDSDGDADTASITGVNGTFTEGMQFNYTGPNHFMDRILPQTEAFTILKNISPAYDNAIAYDGGNYRTIGASFELGGLQAAKSGEVEQLIQKIDEFLVSPSPPISLVPTLKQFGMIILLIGLSLLMITRRLY